MSDSAPSHDAYAALRVPAFRRYLLAGLLVQIGTAGQGVAIGWEIYVRTGSAMSLAIVGLLQSIPMLVLTLPAGYLADVFDRKKIVLLGMIGTTATSVGLAIFSYNEGSIHWMYLLLLLDATALKLVGPARQAMIPQLVPLSKLESAIRWRTSLFQIAAVVGPAVGGFIIAWQLHMAYVVSAASTVVYALILLTIRIEPTHRQQRGRMFAQVWEGVRFVWDRKVLLGTISLDLFAVLLGGLVYLLPIFARDIIELDGTGMTQEQALGWMRAAPAAGALTMALWMAHAPPFRKAGRTMLWSVAAFGVATVVFGFSRNLWLSIGMLVLTGVFDQVSVVIRHTLVQLLTPDEMRGRVSAVNSMFIGSSNEIGGFRAGLVAAWFGPIVSVVAGGVCTLLVVGTWAGLFPRLRQFGRLSEESIEAAAGEVEADLTKPDGS